MGLAPGFWRLKAEQLTPEGPTSMAGTRHLRMNHPRNNHYGLRFPFEPSAPPYSILNTPYSWVSASFTRI